MQGYTAARVRIASGGSDYSLEDPGSNLHRPTLQLNFQALIARPQQRGDSFLAGLMARNFSRRGLAPPAPVDLPDPAAAAVIGDDAG